MIIRFGEPEDVVKARKKRLKKLAKESSVWAFVYHPTTYSAGYTTTTATTSYNTDTE